MARSGTYNFNLDIDEVIQEASEMIGGESTLANEAASARRSINLMLKDWQNRGVLLWSTSTSSFTLTTSVTSYSLDSSTINALEVVISRSNTDVKLTRITPEEYMLSRIIEGDKSDNIIGVEGIGPKRAQALAREHKTLENLLKALPITPAKSKFLKNLNQSLYTDFLFCKIIHNQMGR